MPLFVAERNRIANEVTSSALTLYLHTAAPTDSDPDNARVTTGGGTYASGATIAASDIDAADMGEVTVTADIDFGAAAAAVGTVTHYSLYRGTAPVGYGTLPSTTINNGDSFQINANSLDITFT